MLVRTCCKLVRKCIIWSSESWELLQPLQICSMPNDPLLSSTDCFEYLPAMSCWTSLIWTTHDTWLFFMPRGACRNTEWTDFCLHLSEYIDMFSQQHWFPALDSHFYKLTTCQIPGCPSSKKKIENQMTHSDSHQLNEYPFLDLRPWPHFTITKMNNSTNVQHYCQAIKVLYETELPEVVQLVSRHCQGWTALCT